MGLTPAQRTTIIVALITTVGGIGTALIANRPKENPTPSSTPVQALDNDAAMARALEITQLVITRRYDDLRDASTSAFKAAVPLHTMQMQTAAVMDTIGNLITTTATNISNEGNAKRITLASRFEKGQVIWQILLDDGAKIRGLVFQPYPLGPGDRQ